MHTFAMEGPWGHGRHGLDAFLHRAEDRPRGGRRGGRRGGPPFDPSFGVRGFGGPGFGRGRRARRGDVRPALLALLAEGPKHGYQLIQELAERTDGRWRASPGSVYPTLQQLEDEDLVRAEEMDGKRVFHLTDAGREVVEARPGPPPWEQADEDDDAAVAVMDVFRQVAEAAAMVARAGTETQQAEGARVLADTRRALYRILAEDDA